MFLFRRVLFTLLFNSCLFLLLVIGLQNTLNKSKVDFLLDETVELPIGFIVGASFINGSFLASLLNLKFRKNRNLF